MEKVLKGKQQQQYIDVPKETTTTKKTTKSVKAKYSNFVLCHIAHQREANSRVKKKIIFIFRALSCLDFLFRSLIGNVYVFSLSVCVGAGAGEPSYIER